MCYFLVRRWASCWTGRAPSHCGGKVQAYVDKRTREGRLVAEDEDIDGELNSVLQVCNLAANNEINALIKARYLKRRTAFISTERAKHPDDPDRRIKMNVTIETMMLITEEAICKFNRMQHEAESIRNTSVSAGQNPWRPCADDFKAHLDKLSNLTLYGGCKCTTAVHSWREGG